MSPKFILRFDDICETMAWNRFYLIKDLLLSLNIKPILGVIPINKDPKLQIFKPRDRKYFFSTIKNLQKNNQWSIAQHGTYHTYHKISNDLLEINSKSEFSELSYKQQLNLIKIGKTELLKYDIKSNIFMAPSHSFDEKTLEALKFIGFKYITDGFGFYPMKKYELTFVPQLFSSFNNIGFGIYTVCIHLNTLSDKNFENLINNIKNKRNSIISFDEAIKYTNQTSLMDNIIWNFLKKTLKKYRSVKF